MFRKLDFMFGKGIAWLCRVGLYIVSSADTVFGTLFRCRKISVFKVLFFLGRRKLLWIYSCQETLRWDCYKLLRLPEENRCLKTLRWDCIMNFCVFRKKIAGKKNSGVNVFWTFASSGRKLLSWNPRWDCYERLRLVEENILPEINLFFIKQCLLLLFFF